MYKFFSPSRLDSLRGKKNVLVFFVVPVFLFMVIQVAVTGAFPTYMLMMLTTHSSSPKSFRLYGSKLGFLGGSDGKESVCSAGDPGSIPRLKRSPREGNGNPLQYSCLENSVDRRAWRATIHEVAKDQTPLGD